MTIVITVAHILYNRLEYAFHQSILDRKLIVETIGTQTFWEITCKGKSLYRELIGDFSPTYLFYAARFRKERRWVVYDRTVVSITQLEHLSSILKYLGFEADTLENSFKLFLDDAIKIKDLDDEETNFQLTLLEQEVYKIRKGKLTINKSDQSNDTSAKTFSQFAERLSQMYVPYLDGERFWFYFYGYDKNNINRVSSSDWPLVKLLFEFNGKSGIDLSVTITNTGDPAFHDYSGATDFSTSCQEILVINCRTYPEKDRQLNIKVHIGNGKEDIFLGQYLNYESGYIISGSILMQRIPANTTELTPRVHRIPEMAEEITMYDKDVDGVDKSIIQYLHDKKKNFRRTTRGSGHKLSDLENWLKHQDEKGNGLGL